MKRKKIFFVWKIFWTLKFFDAIYKTGEFFGRYTVLRGTVVKLMMCRKKLSYKIFWSDRYLGRYGSEKYDDVEAGWCNNWWEKSWTYSLWFQNKFPPYLICISRSIIEVMENFPKKCFVWGNRNGGMCSGTFTIVFIGKFFGKNYHLWRLEANEILSWVGIDSQTVKIHIFETVKEIFAYFLVGSQFQWLKFREIFRKNLCDDDNSGLKRCATKLGNF